MDVLSARTIIHPADLDRSLDFYGSVLDLAVARQFGTGPGRGVVFFAGGGLIEVVGTGPTRPGDPFDRGRMALWLQVRDVSTTLDELSNKNVPIARAATLEPWGLIEAWIDDPDGIRIHLVEVPPDHPLRKDPRGAGTDGEDPS